STCFASRGSWVRFPSAPPIRFVPSRTAPRPVRQTVSGWSVGTRGPGQPSAPRSETHSTAIH
ncbi:uncharacterized protein METZ01_LOCUS64449, partial [marine metagenome]